LLAQWGLPGDRVWAKGRLSLVLCGEFGNEVGDAVLKNLSEAPQGRVLRRVD